MRNSNRKTDKLLSMVLDIATNLKDAGEHFHEYKISEEKQLDEFRLNMKKYELKGDELVDELIRTLNNTFITPIEREDALELAARMDDILDRFEECAAHFYMYNIYEIDSYMVDFSSLLHKCVCEIYSATELLSQKKLTEIRQHTIKIKEYVETCDNLVRDAIKVIFEREKDFVRLMQYKDIYQLLKDITGGCKKVGKVLETVIMKNS
ncbi:DUF47 domain-containing protein [Romboutsia sp.]|uniref:DUF47 domain-containing protein n=1 Tax=Romboutsia sp. TaxID=1965302 RepID=UPI003F362F15